jgi:hypothetical protein
MMVPMGAAMATPDVHELVEKTLQENKDAIEQAEETAAKLEKAIEKSDERVEPAVKRLRKVGLLRE